MAFDADHALRADALAKLSLGAEKLHNVPEGQVDSTAQRLWLLAASMWVTTGWSEFCGSLGIRVVDLPIAGLEVQRTGKAPALPTPARSLAPPAPKNDDFR